MRSAGWIGLTQALRHPHARKQREPNGDFQQENNAGVGRRFHRRFRDRHQRCSVRTELDCWETGARCKLAQSLPSFQQSARFLPLHKDHALRRWIALVLSYLGHAGVNPRGALFEDPD
jgi:hypothetical protein